MHLSTEAMDSLRIAFEELQAINEKSANDFWESLTYDQKCDAFHAVVARIVQGDIKEKGSYRYVLYDVFNFDMDMYVRGMDCGYMTLHNSIVNQEQKE
jgi:hypothetical protein